MNVPDEIENPDYKTKLVDLTGDILEILSQVDTATNVNSAPYIEVFKSYHKISDPDLQTVNPIKAQSLHSKALCEQSFRDIADARVGISDFFLN